MASYTLKTKTKPQMSFVAGINGRDAVKPCLKDQVKKNIRIQDEINFINRYKWSNLPSGLDGQMVERMLYYKYQLALFYVEAMEEWFLLPFTLKGNIDVYGRWRHIIPLPYAGGTTNPDGREKPWIDGLEKEVQIELPLNITYEDILNKAVILRDYTLQMGENAIPRSVLQEPIIDYESEIIAFHRTALTNSTGVDAVRVGDESEVANIHALNDMIQRAALNGDKFLATVGQMEFQNLSGTSAAEAQQFMTALYSVDNLRLTFLGIQNGGLAEKQGTILNAEAMSGQLNTGSVLDDGLANRQKFCNIVNAIWGLGIWCEVNQDFDIMQEQNQEQQAEVQGDDVVINDSAAESSDSDSNNIE